MSKGCIYILAVLLLLSCKEDDGETFQEETPFIPIVEKLQFMGEKEYVVDAVASKLEIVIDCNINYSLSISQEWITKVSDQEMKDEVNSSERESIYLQIAENGKDEERNAEIVIYNDTYNLSDTLRIIQKRGEIRLSDGEYQQLQQASVGNANLVIIGDGFTSQHLAVNGDYLAIMRQTAEYFFSVEPYTTYRHYFNVYTVIAESKKEGIGESSPFDELGTKFDIAFGGGTEITCNSDLILEYAHKVKELLQNKPVTVIVVLNSTKYAGTTYLFSDGNSIALCPMSTEESPNDFEGLIHHEAGGHGFGYLCDEYVYYQKEIPDSRIQDLKEWQSLGFQMNLDFTYDLSAILWKDFVGIEKYSTVGAFEGGYEYQYGVWRSEENSCMNNNIPYFNVQSRWSIVDRIMKLSGKDFSIHDFIEQDKFTYPQGDVVTRATAKFVPLGNPVWFK